MADTFLTSIALAQQAALQKFGIRTVVDVDPADEPIQLEDAYAHLHIDFDSSGSAEDVWLDGQIAAAREYCEGYLGRALAPRTLELAASAFPAVAVVSPPGAAFALPFGPVTSIESIAYVDSDGADQGDFEDSEGPLYALDNYVTPARAVTAYGETWPAAQASMNAVKVRYVTGYVREADSSGAPVLPRLARSAMLIVLACAYMEREGKDFAKTLDTAHALLDMVPNRERLGFA